MKIDLEINQGDYHTSSELAKIINKDELNEFDLMAIQSQIQHEYGVTVKIEGNGLRILTSSEATKYNHHRFGLSLKKMYFRHGLLQKVKRDDLSESEQTEHDHRVDVQSRILQSITPIILKEMPIDISTNKMIPKIF